MRAPNPLQPVLAVQAANAAKAPFIVLHASGLVRKMGWSAKLRLA
jgi:hypothetical protein